MNLSVFEFEGAEIRCVGTPESPEWIAQDVCKILGLDNVSEALSDLDDDEKGLAKVDTVNTPSTQGFRASKGRISTVTMLTVTEPGLYNLVFKSRKPEAQRFKRWIRHEVLPSIRKTGQYQINPPTPAEMLLGMAQQLVEQERRLKDSEQQLNSLLENQRRAESELKALPEATVSVAPKTSRAKINELVRNYVARTNANYREIWRKLWKEFFYRCHYNPVQRAKNRGIKPLDVIEQDGKIEDLFAIACELLK
jgi:prophage antirepressor-like protein